MRLGERGGLQAPSINVMAVATLLLCAQPVAAQAQSASQDAYEQLCGPQGRASAATCAGLRNDLAPGTSDASAPPNSIERQSPPQPSPEQVSGRAWAGWAISEAPGASAGVLVDFVDPRGPASAAGLQPYDLIIAANGRRLSSQAALRSALTALEPGAALQLTTVRDNVRMRITLRYAEQKPPIQVPAELSSFLEALSEETWIAAQLSPEGLGSVAKFSWDAASRMFEMTGYAPGITRANDGFHRMFPSDVPGVFIGYWMSPATQSAYKTQALITPDSVQFSSFTVEAFTSEATTYQRIGPARLEARQGIYSGQLEALRGADLAQREMDFFLAGRAILAGIQADVAARFAAEELAKRQAEQRRAEERREFLGQLFQGGVAVAQGYASGMQEANLANARSQAIIDAAAETDRQYRAAQAQAEADARALAQTQALTLARAQEATQTQQAQNGPSRSARSEQPPVLGQTPLGGFPSPTVVNAGGTGPSVVREEASSPSEALLNCYDPRNARSPVCDNAPGSSGQRPPADLNGNVRTLENTTNGNTGIGGTGAGTGVIDFREAVVLCELSGPQAQYGNWRCEGPSQMSYVNLSQGNYDASFAQIDCTNFRELPRAGTYRAFGCGYGIHPTNPGAGRNVPEMLGVFVDGRRTYRCLPNISGVCRSQ